MSRKHAVIYLQSNSFARFVLCVIDTSITNLVEHRELIHFRMLFFFRRSFIDYKSLFENKLRNRSMMKNGVYRSHFIRHRFRLNKLLVPPVADPAVDDPAVATPWLIFFSFFLSRNVKKMERRYPE